MQGTGHTYEYSGETTEWEDILIKKGITTKDEVLLSKGLNPLDYIKNEEEFDEEEEDQNERLDRLHIDELDELLEDDEFSDTRMLEEYRKKRLAEMKQNVVKNRFGDVNEIIKDDWIREVTEGSKSCPVVVHLYSDSFEGCQLVDEAMRIVARKFRYIKFLRIKYNQAIENWPEKNLPTIFVYTEGSLKTQIVTLHTYSGYIDDKDLEWFLAEKDIITDSDLEENPRNSSKTVKKGIANSRFHDDYDDDEED